MKRDADIGAKPGACGLTCTMSAAATPPVDTVSYIGYMFGAGGNPACRYCQFKSATWVEPGGNSACRYCQFKSATCFELGGNSACRCYQFKSATCFELGGNSAWERQSNRKGPYQSTNTARNHVHHASSNTPMLLSKSSPARGG